MTLFKTILFCLFWILTIIIFIASAYYTSYTGYKELSSAIISVMGVVLCSQIFLTPIEIKKYQMTLSIEKKHTAYSELSLSLNELIEPLNLLELEERPFNILSTEEQQNHIKLKSQFADAAELFNKTFKSNTIYYSRNIRKKIAEISKHLIDLNFIFNQISGSKQEEKAKDKLRYEITIISKLIKEIDILVRDELKI